ncbi:FAD-binding and (Fe-S)-binding domain-containing protein [Paractinoplanes brasiliensis]|uniref:FAD/FMN-containing dehydrogenase n=1 Tax=Paractinoplanes brasiliensis TaxID=52695 RepID=A0A4R6JE24_9ACTN|nr:FAD-binding and (Fe-S)-binding domain-containing protein [Actinoplanes brasiliensis]TDO32795.1 FAD/FMN-containing dehydrogenase [Actinoplanes brasiliensis]GID31660.1 lactate dehydrogenase [Actinoplanes brasiliensis]
MSDVVVALEKAGLEVRSDAGTRGMYASDASLYRVPPLAVVRPRHVDEVAAALAIARQTGTPFTSRGAGTSVAGNAIGPGIVLDFSRHLNRVLELDPIARTAVVEPGTIHATLQKAAAPHGVRFGPDPSTWPRCTIGGMIGNNACGSRSLAYGRTSDNVVGLELLTAAGDKLDTTRPTGQVVDDVREVMAQHLATARTEFDRFGRQVSGYAVQHLLPERFDLTQAFVGSEGTLGVITRATVRLVVDSPVRVVVVLGFHDIVAAGEAAPAVVAHGPTSCEGLDSRLLDVLRARRGPDAVPPLPRGGAWLFVELAGDELGEVESRARKLAADGIADDALVVTDPAVQARLWRIREDGAGLAGRSPADRPAWPGWEDAAVPPERLGAYLARFDELVAAYGMSSAPFGHFGDGCMHVRLDFPLDRPDGVKVMREFLIDAARLVGEFGGSLSGEHGDGRARSELLPHMYSADAIALFAGIKHAFDPGNLLNPGVLVDPDPVDASVRPAFYDVKPLAMAYPHDSGNLAQAVHRCTGVGKCRADNSAAGGVMCPSYLATREEKDSTRGRARVLQEVVRGELSWSHPSVHDSLDLCLSCKGCASDCPTGIDMATYKSEALHQKYHGRLRPRSHYTLGRLPFWSRLAGWTPRLANLGTRLPGVRRLALWLAGVDKRRSVPAFARKPFRRTFTPTTGGTPVVLFADSFSDAFSPEVAESTVRVLRAAGYEPRLPSGRVCCGLTWITTGQLDSAKQILSRTVSALAPDARAGIPIVGIEPSCTAVLRSDIHELLPGNPDAAAVASSVRTLAELLAETPGWTPPDLSDVSLIAQPHCHHHAVLGWKADADLLAATGARIKRLSGCCGLAGNFGVEIGHYEVSVAVAEQQLLPALDAAPDALVLADGFSCRTQVADLRDRPAVHLAQLLDR